jgi:acylaminoacyl-peptidase
MPRVDVLPALFSWTVLATDGKNRIICTRSSIAVPYEILLGVVSDNGIQWSILDKPDLAADGTLIVLSEISSND